MERNRERRKVVSANLEDLTECEEEEEEDEDLSSANFSTSPLSSLSSFKNKFHFSLSGKNKVSREKVSELYSAEVNRCLFLLISFRLSCPRTGPEKFHTDDVSSTEIPVGSLPIFAC